MAERLVECCGLDHFSILYRLPTPALSAFSTGLGKHAALIISDGLLHGRELAAVLAHEISHIRHKDIWDMIVADLFNQVPWTTLSIRPGFHSDQFTFMDDA
ncbi:M48 family metalloprotease [Acidithiobacillus thiooxidans]|uniref:M48 family metalloprotease n=1 Tax=Acidithiobacillus thiooxidans TaxID=930 RepID=UPI00285604DA|nr:M48 family metalloprotease [Acidithiobacillus thiooxidans]MDR7926869.1 M48 family metalloprotease [Acidithiobacillus thiooxidans]